MTRPPRLARTSLARISDLAQKRRYRKLMAAYVFRMINRAENLAQKILDEDPNDTYALDVLAKVNARRKNWGRAHQLFNKIYHLDAEHLNICHQMFRTSVYSSQWSSLRTFLAIHPEMFDHPYYTNILHRKLSRAQVSNRWTEITKLANVVELPNSILELWIEADRETLPEIEDDSTAKVERQAYLAGLHGRHTLNHLLRIRAGESDFEKIEIQFGYSTLFEWATLSQTWEEPIVSGVMRNGLREMENDVGLELIQEISQFIPIQDILNSSILPKEFSARNNQQLLTLVDNDLPHRLRTMLKRNEINQAMELVKSIGHLWEDENRLDLWIVVCDVLLQNGYHIPARRILERLLLKNPTNESVAFLHLRTYDMLRLHQEALLPGEIAAHIPNVPVTAIEAHAENLTILGFTEMTETLIRTYSEVLNRRGQRLRMNVRYY